MSYPVDKLFNPIKQMMNISKMDMVPVGTVIKAWREHFGLIPAQLAESAGLSRAYLSQLENLKIRQPSNDQLLKLANALNLELSDILKRRLPTPVESAVLANRASQPGAVGDHIEQLLSTARLSDPEKQLVGQQIIDHAKGIVRLMTTARSLQQDNSQAIKVMT